MAGEGERRGRDVGPGAWRPTGDESVRPDVEVPWRAGAVDRPDDRAGARSGEHPGDEAGAQADRLIRRLFSVGIDLHAALSHVREHIAEEAAVDRIQRAIADVDEAIRDLRRIVFHLGPLESPVVPAGARTLLVDAVKRVCGSAAGCPAITLGGGTDLFADSAAVQHVAALVQEVLACVPADLLSRSHVEVVPDPRPPGRLAVQIDVPGCDVGDVAARLGAADPDVVITIDTVAAPAGSRIRLECPASAVEPDPDSHPRT